MNRRRFGKICSSMVIAASSTPTQVAVADNKKSYQRSLLQFSNTKPLKAADLTIGEPYVFFYPFVTTPCLLINLGKSVTFSKADDASTTSSLSGGTGPQQSIVAYSAICSHKMSHPAKEISFINYRHEPISYFNRAEGATVEQAGLISCCSERSVYDAANGAQVLGGPAPLPLASIEIEYNDSTDELIATGSHGANMYEPFFAKFGFRASMEHKVSDPQQLAADSIKVQKLVDYTRQTIEC